MSSYLVVKQSNSNKSIELKTSKSSGSYLPVKLSGTIGYLPVTTETSGEGIKVKDNSVNYKVVESYTTTTYSTESLVHSGEYAIFIPATYSQTETTYSRTNNGSTTKRMGESVHITMANNVYLVLTAGKSYTSNLTTADSIYASSRLPETDIPMTMYWKHNSTKLSMDVMTTIPFNNGHSISLTYYNSSTYMAGQADRALISAWNNIGTMYDGEVEVMYSMDSNYLFARIASSTQRVSAFNLLIPAITNGRTSLSSEQNVGVDYNNAKYGTNLAYLSITRRTITTTTSQ